MKYRRKTNNIPIILSSILMVLTLAWLTVSLPYVTAVQQQAAEIKKSVNTEKQANDNDDNNPFANTTEEKNPNTINLSEEYLHETHSMEHYVAVPSIEYKVEHVPIYIAFHGELISPPPDLS
jgi:hypothetical protein